MPSLIWLHKLVHAYRFPPLITVPQHLMHGAYNLLSPCPIPLISNQTLCTINTIDALPDLAWAGACLLTGFHLFHTAPQHLMHGAYNPLSPCPIPLISNQLCTVYTIDALPDLAPQAGACPHVSMSLPHPMEHIQSNITMPHPSRIQPNNHVLSILLITLPGLAPWAGACLQVSISHYCPTTFNAWSTQSTITMPHPSHIQQNNYVLSIIYWCFAWFGSTSWCIVQTNKFPSLITVLTTLDEWSIQSTITMPHPLITKQTIMYYQHYWCLAWFDSTSWCMPTGFHLSSPSHRTWCIEQIRARMLFSFPLVQSRTYIYKTKEQKYLIVNRRVDVRKDNEVTRLCIVRLKVKPNHNPMIPFCQRVSWQ